MSGLCSSDDEDSDRPPITLKLSQTQGESSSTNAATAVTETVVLQQKRLYVLLSVDDGSDWSTLTAESGEDTPTWPVTTETDECEVVRCVCEVDEENDFMIQVKHIYSHTYTVFLKKKACVGTKLLFIRMVMMLPR